MAIFLFVSFLIWFLVGVFVDVVLRKISGDENWDYMNDDDKAKHILFICLWPFVLIFVIGTLFRLLLERMFRMR
jgi:hypothetical protein